MSVLHIVFITFFLFGFSYLILPSIWYRVFSGYTVKSVKPKTVAITFDDGPDPDNTPRLLDKLEELGVKVTFFVLGSAVNENRDIVKRAIEEGHEVALHGMDHRCHWFLSPSATYQDVHMCFKSVKKIGGKPEFYRPPWGLYNIFTVLACKKYGLRCVHWSLHAYDWSTNTSTEDIIKTINNKLKSGDIILLHDGRGAENAPKRTRKALSTIIQIINKKKLKHVKPNSKTIRTNKIYKMIKFLQIKFEKLFVNIMGWEHIPDSENELIYIDIKEYRGKDFKLDDTTIYSGDTVAEIHIDNLHINSIESSYKSILHNYQREFKALVHACQTVENYKNIKAIYGVTVLHTFLQRKGFTCFPVKNSLIRNYLKFYENMLRRSFNKKSNKKKKLWPKKCWISIEKLKKQLQKNN